MATVHIGMMRTKLIVQRRGLTQDALGEQVQTYTTVGTVWADVKALSGRELEAAQAVRATDTHQITLRYLPGLSAKDHFHYFDPEGVLHDYAITDVIDVDDLRHRYMQCTAQEGLTAVP